MTEEVAGFFYSESGATPILNTEDLSRAMDAFYNQRAGVGLEFPAIADRPGLPHPETCSDATSEVGYQNLNTIYDALDNNLKRFNQEGFLMDVATWLS